jgi:hypothetical protein
MPRHKPNIKREGATGHYQIWRIYFAPSLTYDESFFLEVL